MRRELLRDALLYLAAALLLGTAANLVPARHLAWWGKGAQPPTAGTDFAFLDAASAETLRVSLPGVVFVDTRGAEEHELSRIPGAVRLSYTDLDAALTPELEARLRGADAVVLYGSASETDVEQLLAQALRGRGLPPPYVLLGGFPSWETGALPIEGEGAQE